MKVILTGVTGFVGGEVLRQSLKHPSITSIVALARRDLPDEFANKTKVKLVKIDDFSTYSDEAIKECAGAEACIWNIGTTPKKKGDLETIRKVDVDWLATAAETFTTKWDLPEGKKFRFVYTSGFMVENDNNASLWLLGDFRKLRGEGENQLNRLASEYKDRLQVVIIRPAAILSTDNFLFRTFLSKLTVQVTQVAAATIDYAVSGTDQSPVSNAELRSKAESLAKK